MPDIVTEPDALDTDWLTAALRDVGLLPHGRVRDVHWQVIGTGKMGDNVRYTLSYQDASATAPDSLVAKLPAADATSRANAGSGGVYRREVCFYREIASRVPMRTPQVHLARIHENQTDFVILMEDLAPARPGDQILGCGPDRAELAIREAAKLHGPLVGDSRLEHLDWLMSTTPEAAEFGQALLQQMWPSFLRRFEAVISPEGAAMAELYIGAFARWSLGFPGLRTLVHADYRLENLLFGTGEGGPPIAVVDWQTVQHTCPLIDVAYFLGGGLPVEMRREHEAELVEIYRRELALLGVEIARDECWQLYRRSALHGIMITVLGCMFTGQDERGDRMFAAMIERHLQHAVDLECGEFLA